MNGPTIFTGGGRLQLIARGQPFGPNGGVLLGIRCDVAQGGPMCGPDAPTVAPRAQLIGGARRLR